MTRSHSSAVAPEHTEEVTRLSRATNCTDGDLVTRKNGSRCYVRAWALSTTVHCIVLMGVLGLVVQSARIAQNEPFRWDVVLLQSQQNQKPNRVEASPIQPAAIPDRRPIVHPFPRPQPLKEEVSVPEATKDGDLISTSGQDDPTIDETPVAQATQLETAIAEQESVTVPPALQPLPQPLTDDQSTIETVLHTLESDLPVPSKQVITTASQEKPVAESIQPQMATAAGAGSSATVDRGWLAELLARRLAEIKRYPSAARFNGWEGKVVLRAVIRADGHLSDVKVHKSSGYDVLDNAAMDAVRSVCPLRMDQSLGASEVVVYVPIVYSLRS